MTDNEHGPPNTAGSRPQETGDPEVSRRADDVASLYQDAAQDLYHFVSRLGLGPHDAEDVVAEAFAVLWRMPEERYDRLANSRSYLFVVARHLAYRTFKAAGRVVAVDDGLLDQQVVHHDDPVVYEEHARLSRVALKALPTSQQAVLWGSLVEGRSSRSLADELGTTVTNITTQAQRARTALRHAYLAEFLNQNPRVCGFDVRVLARTILGTASVRQTRMLEQHLAACDTCRGAVIEGSDEMRSVSSRGIALVGAVALGWLGRTPPGPQSRPAGVAPPRHRTGAVRTALAVAGFILGLALPSLSLLSAHIGGSGDTASTPNQGGSAGPLKELTEPGPGVDISASPAAHDLTMPSPGQSIAWITRVVSHTVASTNLAVSVEALGSLRGAGPDREVPWIHFELNGERLGTPMPITAYAGRLLYVGELPAGTTLSVTGTAARLETDTDTSLSATLRIRFVAGLDVADGAEPGTLVADPEWGGTTLPNTGAGISWRVQVAGVLMIVSGVALVRSARQSRRRRDGAGDLRRS